MSTVAVIICFVGPKDVAKQSPRSGGAVNNTQPHSRLSTQLFFNAAAPGNYRIQRSGEHNCFHYALNNYFGEIVYPFATEGTSFKAFKRALQSYHTKLWIHDKLQEWPLMHNANLAVFKNLILPFLGKSNGDVCCGSRLLDVRTTGVRGGHAECNLLKGRMCELNVHDMFMLASFRYHRIHAGDKAETLPHATIHLCTIPSITWNLPPTLSAAASTHQSSS